MTTEEKVHGQEQRQAEAPLSVALEKNPDTSTEQYQNNVNKIGIKYHSVKDSSTQARNSHVTALDRWILKQVLDTIGHPPIKLVLWNGEAVYGSDKQDVPTVTLCDRGALLRLIVDPEIHFGDMYSSGRIRFEGDLAVFLTEVFNSMSDYGTGNRLRRFITGLLHHTVGNTLTRARDNIHHHYDLSNEFYRKWLDTEAMQYTCAYFPRSNMTLEQAQVAKLHHVCRKLQLKPGERVVEAGCGWGGLARFMAQHYGVTVKAYNISHEQISFARNKAQQMGLADRVEYVEDDYRNIEGEYDVFVSVGMLEHVGLNNYRTLGTVIDRCLKPEGRGLVHSISRDQPGQMSSWIERRIFPGAYAPALSEMMDIFEHQKFSVWDIENLRLHYASTLEHWLARFEAHSDEVSDMFDESFVRAWRLYLCGSIASFVSGANGLLQILFARSDNNDVPWSRDYIYSAELEASGSRETQQ